MSQAQNARTIAALTIFRVVFRGRQLNRVLENALDQANSEDRGIVTELTYGVVRWFWLLEHELNQLLTRPVRRKDQDLLCLLCVGLYQLKFMRIPQYACVSETVDATADLGKPWARGLVNAILRKYLSCEDQFESKILTDDCRYSHPQWIVELIKQEWPEYWEEILRANNCRPKMTLRLNVNETGVSEYLDILKENHILASVDQTSPVALQLAKRIGVEKLPGFSTGVVSVQSSASQLAALSMELAPGQRVLDACSAPGGKLVHMLEIEPDLEEILAIDIDQARTAEIVDNLSRVQNDVQVITADAARPDEWWDGKPFDRILVDAPCSALGVVSKHPDIKHHRKPADLDRVVEKQRHLLEGLLPLLNRNGKLLYTTCSILARENDGQIEAILRNHPYISIDQLPPSLGHQTQFGRQRLQDGAGGDGFYYARLKNQ